MLPVHLSGSLKLPLRFRSFKLPLRFQATVLAVVGVFANNNSGCKKN